MKRSRERKSYVNPVAILLFFLLLLFNKHFYCPWFYIPKGKEINAIQYSRCVSADQKKMRRQVPERITETDRVEALKSLITIATSMRFERELIRALFEPLRNSATSYDI